MDFREVITTRRSIRSYSNEPVSRAEVQDLLVQAVMAPSASNSQPWKFCVIQKEEQLADLSNRTKSFLLSALKKMPGLESYRDNFVDPTYSIFYGATTLVLIVCEPNRPSSETDCALAAENLMLAAREKGIGSCWMGFASVYCNLPEVKAELAIPEKYKIVAPIALGYPRGNFAAMEHKPPEILFWNE